MEQKYNIEQIMQLLNKLDETGHISIEVVEDQLLLTVVRLKLNDIDNEAEYGLHLD